MRHYYWSLEYFDVELKKQTHSNVGIVVETLSPRMGVCQDCKRRTLVRHHPFNAYEPLGYLCKKCAVKFDKAMSEANLAADEDTYD